MKEIELVTPTPDKLASIGGDNYSLLYGISFCNVVLITAK